jgi:hypothetical protein
VLRAPGSSPAQFSNRIDTMCSAVPCSRPGLVAALLALGALPLAAQGIGQEVAVPRHLADGEEFLMPLADVLVHGRLLFSANWTDQEGGGRPLSKGTGKPLSDPSQPLEFPRNFNRISAPDANSCAGCHNAPFGVPGGGGDVVTNVFVLGQRFDFATFDGGDPVVTGGAVDESGGLATLDDIANFRSTLGMWGAGYIEMLARQMTADLRGLRDVLAPGGSVALASKGVSFGTLSRAADGAWDVSAVVGLSAGSLATSGPSAPPSLLVKPFHQAGAVVSLREFSNNAMNHHHGIQPLERFGAGGDVDGDGHVDELTTADVTALAFYQATLPVPGRRIPNDPAIEAAVLLGEDLFVSTGCTSCHVPSLPLDEEGWHFSEPNPDNPAGNLRTGDPYVLTFGTYTVDLNDRSFPGVRLRAHAGVVRVPAFTDLKLHDITSAASDPNREPLDMHQPAGSAGFFAGNSRFLTKKLWGCANEPPFFHHGRYTTLRASVEAHAGEAASVMDAYRALPAADQDALIEFLKSLQVLPPGVKAPVVDENDLPKRWRPFPG